jgi:hypothetical protein
MVSPSLTIEAVEADFALWRINKKYNSPAPIPETLCNQIRVLLHTYPRAEVLRRCGVTLQQARSKGLLPLTSDDSTSKNKELTPFVRIPLSPATPLKTITLSLRCGDAHLSLDNPSHEQIQLIITTMLR